MKILILGATGRTGQQILKEALSNGFKISCLVRSSGKLKDFKDNPNVEIHQGTPANIEDLRVALNGCDAILSALNISRKSDFPWSSLRTPKTLLSDVMQHIITLSTSHPFEHLVVCSAWGVNETIHDIPWWFRATIRWSNIRYAYQDHARQEELLSSVRNFKWTVVRPSGLINRTKMKPIRISFKNEPKPFLTISRKEVATFMLEVLSREDLWYKRPTISSSL